MHTDVCRNIQIVNLKEPENMPRKFAVKPTYLLQ